MTTPTLAASASAYYNSGTGCTAPCYYTIALSGNPNDTNSSPFYTYTSTVSDTLFVGDDSGKLHKFNPVFKAAPAEVTTSWPVAASTSTNPKLTSPVYDGGASQLVFVEDATGYLNSVSVRRHPRHRPNLETDGVRELWVRRPSRGGLIYRIRLLCLSVTAAPTELPLSTPATSTYLPPAPPSTQVTGTTTRSLTTKPPTTSAPFNTTACSITLTTQGSGNTGNLYACVNGALYQFGMAQLSTTTQVTALTSPGYSVYHTPASTVSDAATCSALTEYCNNGSSACTVSGGVTNAGTDYLFLSLDANGKTVGSTTCAGGCIYNYNITSGGATGTPADALQVAGGSGSIVIDNSGSATGESQVYYGSLSSQTCVGNGTVGSGSGSCAVQASQSALQ